MWGMSERQARKTLHDLSLYDSGDDFILIRSSGKKGFYKTDNLDEIKAYKKECLNKGRSIFAPVKKINRVLSAQDETQFTFTNNLRLFRQERNLSQKEVCHKMRKYDGAFDKPLLSRMENGVCLPTYFQLLKLADIYGCEPFQLIDTELY